MSVSGKVVKLREHRGLNQKELAESLGMNRSVLNRIENGTRPVRDDELKLFADYFNVSADYLLGRDAANVPPLSDEQATLLKGFAALNSGGRKLLIGVLDSLRVSHAAAVWFGGDAMKKLFAGVLLVATIFICGCSNEKSAEQPAPVESKITVAEAKTKLEELSQGLDVRADDMKEVTFYRCHIN